MGSWTLDDIPWHRFDRNRLDPEIVRIVKAAALVEHNGAAYARHLCRIFADDPAFQETARRWGEEETQHGRALARWAALADPDFDFDRAFLRFQAGFQVDFDSARSRRGSRAGEMVARCIVEIGTSSYYTALREAAAEPVLQEICRHIAADELRHYRLFYKNLDRCLARGADRAASRGSASRSGGSPNRKTTNWPTPITPPMPGDLPYDRRHYTRAYARRAYALYRPHHVERGVAMLLKAVGLTPNGRLGLVASRLLWRAMRYRAARLAKMAA